MSETTEYARVLIERNDTETGYTIHALPMGKSMKDKNYEELTASWLKVNDVGFACKTAEFSEYQTPITIKQDFEGGSANIKF